MNLSDLSVPKDELHDRLQMKHAQLRLHHIAEMQKSLDVDQSLASKKMHKLPASLDLISDEIVIILNEVSVRCEENGMPQVVSLLKDARALMNRQLREAYGYLEEGYVSAYNKLNEEANVLQRKREESERQLALEKDAAKLPPGPLHESMTAGGCASGFDSVLPASPLKKLLNRPFIARPKTLAIDEALSATTSFFAETLAVMLHCEAVRIYLYDEYENLNCCVRFPFETKECDPLSGTNLELMLAKEVHRTVCRKCIAVNGTEPCQVTMSERDRELYEEEIQRSGWKSMTSCLIFPIFSDIGVGRSFGMIHAVNKQGVTADQCGAFDDGDEVLVSIASRLLGCLLTRYPVKFFTLPVGRIIQQQVDASRPKENARSHLPILLEDEVEGAAISGNKASVFGTRILMYRAPINAIYQTRLMRKKARRLEALEMIDKGLSTVEFDLSALEELWRTGHEENTVMYQHCQHLNDRVNTLQVLLRNVLDGIGASRVMTNMRDIANYLQMLELYARRENTLMVAELITQALLTAKVELPVLEELKGTDPTRLSPDEIVRLERRVAQTPAKLKFFESGLDSVRTYANDPQKKREQVRFFTDLADQRTVQSKTVLEHRGPSYKKLTKASLAKRKSDAEPYILSFLPVDYAKKRSLRLKDD